MKYIHFYATAADLMPLLGRIDEIQHLKYVQTGKRWEINRPVYLRASELPSPGISTNESGSLSIRYLVSPRDIKNVMYTATNDSGRRFWHLSNGDNPDSVNLTMGGLCKTGTLLPGNMSTVHNTVTAQNIMRRFLASIQAARFAKYDVYWIGHEAFALLKAGRRLVDAEQAPASYDVPHPSQWPNGV